jgi:hypothetical protein
LSLDLIGKPNLRLETLVKVKSEEEIEEEDEGEVASD